MGWLGGKNRPAVFVSYKREEHHIAKPLVDVLRAANVGTFFDSDSIPPEANWRDELGRALSACRALFVLWSNSASRSSNVEWEWTMAARIANDRRRTLLRLLLGVTPKIMPILLDDTPLPDGL